MIMVMKCELLWAPFSEFLVVLLMSMAHRRPLSESFPSHVQHVAAVRRDPQSSQCVDLNGNRSGTTSGKV